MSNYVLTIFLFFVSQTLTLGQNVTGTSRLTQQPVLSLEKIYIQTDRSIYVFPDTIWFKACLVNAETNTPSEVSGLVYVQMVNNAGDVVQTLCLPTAGGVAWSGFDLNNWKYRPGTYTLIAYTNWMRNFGEATFFKKQITILDGADAEQAILDTATKNTTVSSSSIISSQKNKTDPDIQFLIEGGTWLTGKPQLIAFKAIGSNGIGLAISGEIVDSRKQRVAKFQSNSKGMGVFTLTAQEGENYTAQIKTKTENYTQKLPVAITDGTALQLLHSFSSDTISIFVYSELKNQILTLSGEARGKKYFITHILANKKEREVHIAKNIFPPGVCKVKLQDATGKILNERAFFIHTKDKLQIDIKADKPFYTTRENIVLNLDIHDIIGQVTTGSFAMVVTDDGQVEKDSNECNILTYLLLTSDIKGEIENPSYYFETANETAYNDLDVLLLTQGWTSYSSNIAKEPQFKPEKEFTVSGKITNVMNKPLVNAQLSLMSFRKGFVMLQAKTNEQGEFTFRDFPVLDSASFLLKAVNVKGKTGTLGINLAPFGNLNTFPKLKQNQVRDTLPITDTIVKKMLMVKQQEYRATNGAKVLKEVTIVGKKTVGGSKNRNGAGNADIVLNEEDMAKTPKKTLMDLIKEKAEKFYINYRGLDGLYTFNNKTLSVYIDGVNIYTLNRGGWKYIDLMNYILEAYSAEDIRGIEIMTSWKYSKNVAYVEVTTKTGLGPYLPNQAFMITFRPPNYGNYKSFYNPRYTVANKNNTSQDFRSTIYWNPHIQPNQQGKAKVSFFSSDRKGSYTIWIEGTDLQGSFGMKAFKVKIN
ncbi:hypothetical protein [Pedobacter sp. MW01-1-1]|uniref:hypothetical protein n=1 Tax=Pedobacter sp. MW01-1-1 TaxID=3383027 RepID=UPI003FEE8619